MYAVWMLYSYCIHSSGVGGAVPVSSASTDPGGAGRCVAGRDCAWRDCAGRFQYRRVRADSSRRGDRAGRGGAVPGGAVSVTSVAGVTGGAPGSRDLRPLAVEPSLFAFPRHQVTLNRTPDAETVLDRICATERCRAILNRTADADTPPHSLARPNAAGPPRTQHPPTPKSSSTALRD